MPDDTREARAVQPPLLPAWGSPSTASHEDGAAGAAWWLSGGAGLLLWTVFALVLTSA
jgi:hypothetical protein